MRHAGGLSPSIAGMVVAALVALGLGVLGALLCQRHRRRQLKGIFAPAAASSDKRGSISSLRGTCGTADEAATSSAIGNELFQAAFQINPADIVIDLDEQGNKVMLGMGSFGKVQNCDGLQSISVGLGSPSGQLGSIVGRSDCPYYLQQKVCKAHLLKMFSTTAHCADSVIWSDVKPQAHWTFPGVCCNLAGDQGCGQVPHHGGQPGREAVPGQYPGRERGRGGLPE